MQFVKAEVIVFDQGNVLVMDPFLKVMDLKREHFKKIFERHGLFYYSSQQIIEAWVKSNRDVNYPYIAHFFQEEPIIQNALSLLQIQCDVSTLASELLKAYRRGLKKCIVIDPRTKEVRKVLKQLKLRKKRLGVFSNDRTVALKGILHWMDITEVFEYITASEEVRFEKPDSRVFQHIVSHFNVSPQDIVYIGDDPKKDIEPAKEMGLKSIRYSVDKKYNESWRNYNVQIKHNPDATVSNFPELLDIII